MEKNKDKRVIKTYKDLNVYQRSYKLSMEIFKITKTFPKEEIYSLTDQIRRSSRSVAVNIVEGWAKRKYENVFLRHLNIANGSCEETKIWLKFAKDCGYITEEIHNKLLVEYHKIGAMLYSLLNNWKTFDSKTKSIK